MKMFKGLFILIVFLGIFLSKEAYSDSAQYGDNNVIPLRLKADVVIEVEFPENIANVTKSVPSALLQIETSGNRMYLLARENFDSSIYVATQDDLSYCLRLTVGVEEVESFIKIKKPGRDNMEAQDKKIINTIEVLKALIKGEPFRYVVSSKLNSQEIFNNGSIRIVIDEIYEFQGGTKAIVLIFENLTSKPIVVPIEHIELPGLLAISIKSQVLEARREGVNKKPDFITKAYMIVEGL